MIPRVVEISSSGRYVHCDRGFLVVEEKGEECGRVPLDDIGVLLLASSGISISTNLLSRLTERGASIVYCDESYQPSGIIFPTLKHRSHIQRLKLQIDASEPLKKRLWQTIVQNKIINQARVLELFRIDTGPLKNMARAVLSGDSSNREALAARYYWTKLFEKDFRRDTNGRGINALLNYGYAILRAGVARAVVAGGLHPAFGLHHSNLENPWLLVDDLIEPYRPIVDIFAKKLVLSGCDEITPEAKKELSKILIVDLTLEEETTILSQALHRLVSSLISSYQNKVSNLILPDLSEQFSDGVTEEINEVA